MKAKAEKYQLNQWEFWAGALGGTRTPTILLTATSRQRVYQFRHERFATIPEHGPGEPDRPCHGADVTNGSFRNKGLQSFGPQPRIFLVMPLKSGLSCENDPLGGARSPPALALVGRFRQHPLHLDGDAVAVDDHRPGCDRQVVGQNLDLVLLGGIKFDDGPAAQPHDLMNRHPGGPENHHEIDGNVIDCRHCT